MYIHTSRCLIRFSDRSSQWPSCQEKWQSPQFYGKLPQRSRRRCETPGSQNSLGYPPPTWATYMYVCVSVCVYIYIYI